LNRLIPLSFYLFLKKVVGLVQNEKTSPVLKEAKHNILFVCSSLEPGNDGVGDYTRKLACALISRGHRSAIIAINDRLLKDDAWEGKQCDNNTEVDVLRLSSELPWKYRMDTAKKFTGAFNASWISLQYVPFGFHLKGLPFNLGKKLKQTGVHQRWHIMFHELSVNKDESIKFRIWAILQERIIRSLIKKLKPALISANTEIYRSRLEKMGYPANRLPLFSNISHANAIGKTKFDAIIPAYISEHRAGYIIGTLFGSFDFKRWDIRSLLNKFSYGYSEKRVVIVSVGKMSSGKEYWEKLKYDYPQVLFLGLGIQPPGFISWWLSHYTDFGILTTLPELAGKSGSFMAFKEHGIPVVCKEQTGALEEYHIPLDKGLTVINAKRHFNIPPRYQPVSSLDNVVQKFIKDLETVKETGLKKP
jgi:hypothetical protein